MHLSILIPVYNAEGHIIHCLESIINQGLSVTDYEVLILDDGSTDNSSKVISDYIKDKDNMILMSQENQGNAKTRNKLFELAKGTYIYCLDADDYLVPNSLEGILTFALDSDMDFVGFKSRQTQLLNQKVKSSKKSLDHIDIYSGAEYLKERSLPNVEVWWYLVSRELLTKYKITLDEMTMADVVFTYKIVLSSRRLCIVDDHVHWYYQSTESLMRAEGNMSKHKSWLADNTYEMVLALNDLIESPEFYNPKIGLEEKKDLIKKRDYYSFFMLLKFLRFEKNSKKIKDRISTLANKGMYPFSSHINIHRAPYFLEKLINMCVNNKSVLFALITLFSFFKLNNKDS